MLADHRQIADRHEFGARRRACVQRAHETAYGHSDAAQMRAYGTADEAIGAGDDNHGLRA